ncbi:enoyl-ACP reductase FabI [Anaplasma marginale]|uniref:Enoyl-[acyl-carrier-protein] reductase [NADH] n=4 Tax=Anaplasmataceae TaxID=942 RepID=B9KI72_ANAMF|nr:enoyl-[acyl-carrier-protein] reductase [Anaplasma marginale str. St. Maries]ACM49184.1 enoyl-[acyl-carrier-protein] reductase (fab1) [Anaplasma marginale str. Florida]ACZ49397.1 enoyl-[acyl-carrier-protein] reductase [Anaplasma centrale str. Israel]KAA8475285.1 enoyl-ACP reductase FabI [Anaplasma marginale]KAB0452856.1 enoyl-ACP reductase FabI [Anaplasma marginale]
MFLRVSGLSVHTGGLMRGKRGVIIGVANDRSLAWGIAKVVCEHGAEVAFTYFSDALKKRVEPLAESVGSKLVMPCDVSDHESIDSMFSVLEREWGSIDFIVHAVAFSDRNELQGRYIDTTLDNFLLSMHVSCYSLTAVARRAESMMEGGGSILTLSYYGAEKVVPNYNVMGVCKAALEASVRYLAVDLGKKQIRVNAISAGPVRTLAAAGLGGFRYILAWNRYNAPLRRNTSIEEVGGAAMYLLSDLGRGTTGEVLHVDSGYHVVGIKDADAPDITRVKDEV